MKYVVHAVFDWMRPSEFVFKMKGNAFWNLWSRNDFLDNKNKWFSGWPAWYISRHKITGEITPEPQGMIARGLRFEGITLQKDPYLLTMEPVACQKWNATQRFVGRVFACIGCHSTWNSMQTWKSQQHPHDSSNQCPACLNFWCSSEVMFKIEILNP